MEAETESDDQDNHNSTTEDSTEHEESQEDRQAINVQYGTLISCIDFGDQLGALVLGALVAALDVSRENNWKHLDDLTQLCCVIGICSASFVLILR